MKIFNWVNRRFHHKDGLGRNVKKTEFVTNYTDTQELLEHVTLVDVLDGWRDGILTIGTFGFDPLKDFNEKVKCPMADKEEEEEDDEECDEEEYLVDDDEDDNEMEDEGELNPLVFTAFRHGFHEKDSDGPPDHHHHHHQINAAAGKAHDLIMTIDGTPRRPNQELGLNSEYDKMKKRITLADLFSADSDANYSKPPGGKIQPEISGCSTKKPTTLLVKNGRSFAKKLIPRVGEDSRPIQKLHRLMTRMLKRKIHPDLEDKILKKESQAKPSVLGLRDDKCAANNESLSLLHTQDAMV